MQGLKFHIMDNLYKWILGVLCLALTGTGFLCAQSVNGTQQLPNMGFEEYDNLGDKTIEPVGWNSFYTANVGSSLIAMGQEQRLDRQSVVRPGSSGTYSMRVYATNVIGVNANGNVTTGRINMGSTTADNPANYNFTDRASAGFNLPFTVIPDSMIIWAQYNNASAEGQIKAVIHNDNNERDPGTNLNNAVAIATINPTKGNGGWIRYSVPFSRTGCNSNDPRYILVSITTNKKPGGDMAEIWVDDIFFYYAPTLTLGNVDVLSYNVRYGAAEIQIPFQVTGTLEHNSNSKKRNEIIAELSDINGSFDNPVEIGRMETCESGTIVGYIPANTPLGTGYRVRVRSTETPLTTQDNGTDLTVMKGYSIDVQYNSVEGKVSGMGAYAEGSTATLVAVPSVGYDFVGWKENGQMLPEANSPYSFTVTADRKLEAVFAIKKYTLKLSMEGMGSLSPDTGSYTYEHNQRVRLTATPAEMYEFNGYYTDGVLRSKDQVYEFNMTGNTQVVARFIPGKLNISATPNNASLGSVSGNGLYESGGQVTLTAKPNPFCDFVAWMNGTDTLSKDLVYQFEATTNLLLTAVFAAQTYTVTLKSQPEGAGSLSGGGRFSATESATTIRIEATPKQGYEFLYWQSGSDEKQLEDNPYLVLESGRLIQNLEFTAYFSLIQYPVDLVCSPAGAGILKGQGSYTFGQKALLVAEPVTGYRFVAWLADNKDTLSREEEYSHLVNGETRITAVFERTSHRVDASVKETGYGSVTGGKDYFYGDTAILTALPSSGYEFRYWARKNGLAMDTVSEENPLRFEVTGATDLIAVFSLLRKSVSVDILPQQGGQVKGEGRYEHGSNVQLEASANTGYTFEAWYKQDMSRISSDPRLRIQLDKDTILCVKFAPKPYTVNLMTEGMSSVGEVKFSHGDFALSHQLDTFYDARVEVEAKAADPSYRFIEWRLRYQKDGIQVDTFFSRDFQTGYVVKGDVTLVACFAQNAAGVEAQVSPSGAGKVLHTGNYMLGKWVELVAEPAFGYQFRAWTDGSGKDLPLGSPIQQIQIMDDTVVYADFETAVYGIRSEAYPHGAGSVKMEKDSYQHSEMVDVESQAAYGYTFEAWYDRNDTAFQYPLSREVSYLFEAVADCNLVARFVPMMMQVQAEVYPANTGKVEGKGSYAYQSSFMLSAEPIDGYEFLGWVFTHDGEDSDTVPGNVLRGKVEEDLNLKALFQPVILDVNVASRQAASGSVVLESTGPYHYTDTLEAFAKASSNYVFSQWVDAAGKRISKENPLVLCLVSDTMIYAEFAAAVMRLDAQSQDDAQGYVMPYDNRPSYGSVVHLVAEPMPGYRFRCWQDSDGTDISTSSILECQVTSDTNLVAVFEKDHYQVRLVSSIPQAGLISMDRLEEDDTVALGDFASSEYLGKLRLQARPTSHYTFSAWELQGLTLSEDSVYDFTVTGNSQVTAHFEPVLYQVEVNTSSQTYGQVSGGGYFAYGESIPLKAEPANGCVFVAWKSGEAILSLQPEFNLSLEQDTALTAVFQPDSVDIEVVAFLGGEVSGGGHFAPGDEVTVTANPGQAYRFERWVNISGETVSEQNPYVFQAKETDVLYAHFTTLDISVDVLAGEGGKVIGQGSYPYGSQFSLSAVPDSGFAFSKWVVEQGQLDGRNLNLPLLTLTARADLRLKAEFVADVCHLQTLVSPLEAGSVTPGGDFNYGGSVQFEAKPSENYQFLGWTRNGEWISEEAVLKAEVKSDATYVAVFLPKKYNLLTTSYPTDAALTYGSGSYYWKDTALIEAKPYAGYSVDSWTDIDFETLSSAASFQYVVTRVNMFTVNLDGSGVTKVESVESGDGSLMVYPNPVGPQGLVYLVMDESAIHRVSLYDMSGIRVDYKEFSPSGVDKVQLSVGHLTKGCYIYVVERTDGSVLRGKLIRM